MEATSLLKVVINTGFQAMVSGSFTPLGFLTFSSQGEYKSYIYFLAIEMKYKLYPSLLCLHLQHKHQVINTWSLQDNPPAASDCESIDLSRDSNDASVFILALVTSILRPYDFMHKTDYEKNS